MLIDILCNNSIAAQEDCRQQSLLDSATQLSRRPAEAPNERSVKDAQEASSAEIANDPQQHMKSKSATQRGVLLSGSLQQYGATRQCSSLQWVPSVPLIGQEDEVCNECHLNLRERATRRQLNACSSSAKAAEQHAPAMPERQTCCSSRTGNGATQKVGVLSSIGQQKPRQTIVHRSKQRAVKQQKVGLHAPWGPPLEAHNALSLFAGRQAPVKATCPDHAFQQSKLAVQVLVLGAGRTERHLHAQQRAARPSHMRSTWVPSSFNYYDHGHGSWVSVASCCCSLEVNVHKAAAL